MHDGQTTATTATSQHITTSTMCGNSNSTGAPGLLQQPGAHTTCAALFSATPANHRRRGANAQGDLHRSPTTPRWKSGTLQPQPTRQGDTTEWDLFDDGLGTDPDPAHSPITVSSDNTIEYLEEDNWDIQQRWAWTQAERDATDSTNRGHQQGEIHIDPITAGRPGGNSTTTTAGTATLGTEEIRSWKLASTRAGHTTVCLSPADPPTETGGASTSTVGAS